MNKQLSRKIFLSLVALGMAFQMAACSSNEQKSDGDEEIEAVEGLEEGGEADLAGGDESLPEDALGAETGGGEIVDPLADSSAPMDASSELDIADSMGTDVADADLGLGASDEPAPLVSDSGAQDSAAMDMPAPEAPVADTSSPEPEPMMPEDTSSVASTHGGESSYSEPAEAPVRKNIPLQKMASQPWKVSGQWFNGIYFARPGDTLDSISQSIYGEDRTDLLRRANPTYSSRDPRPGDKVYYASPKRPDDSSQMLTWFEDNGLQPQVYVAKEGESIREISKNLLGYDGAWKETWSSNPSIESKGALNEGTEIRYWASLPNAGSGANVAANTTPSSPANSESSSAPPAPDQAALPPDFDASSSGMGDMPAPPDLAANDIPPPPPLSENDFPPPPPPLDIPPPPIQASNDIPPPPPPPLDRGSMSAGMEDESSGTDQDAMMALGAIAIGAVGLAGLLVVRKKRKQKDMEMHIDSTQVG